MTQTVLMDQLIGMLGIVLVLSLPPLLAAMAIGLLVGILQAVTQVQDQSLPVAVKLLVVIVVLIFAGPLLIQPLAVRADRVFDSFPAMTR